MLPRPRISALAPPPGISTSDHSLFIDFDGTLVPLVDRPDEVAADPDLVDLLAALHARFGGRLAVVSGRSIEQLDRIIGPLAAAITLAGSHGAEIRQDGRLVQPPRAPGLEDAMAELRAYAVKHPALIVEIKSLGVALHYRMAPEYGQEAIATAVAIAARHALVVQPGKMMIELHGAGCDKGQAVEALMGRAPMLGSMPVMLGDELTDEPALAAAAALGGFGVLVGPERATAALYNLADVADVRGWLWRVAR